MSSERARLAERIPRQADNKDSYAVLRLVEEMCASTSPSRWARWARVRRGGRGLCRALQALQAAHIHLAHRTLLLRRPGWDEIRSAFSEAPGPMPWARSAWDMGTDIRMNSVEEKPRVFRESADLSQGSWPWAGA